MTSEATPTDRRPKATPTTASMSDEPDRSWSCSWTTSSTVSTVTGAPSRASPIAEASAAESAPSSARTRIASGTTSAGACSRPSSVMWRVSRIDAVSGRSPETVTESSPGPDVTPSSVIVSPTATPRDSASSAVSATWSAAWGRDPSAGSAPSAGSPVTEAVTLVEPAFAMRKPDSSIWASATPLTAVTSSRRSSVRTSADSWGSEGSAESSVMTAMSVPAHEERTWFSSVSPKACENSSAATMNATDTAIAMPAATRRPEALRRLDRAMRIIGHLRSGPCQRHGSRLRPVRRPRVRWGLCAPHRRALSGSPAPLRR